MNFRIDSNLKAVAEFTQSNISSGKLVGVAHALSALAPSLWDQYGSNDIIAFELNTGAIHVQSHDDDQHIQSIATE